MTIIDKTGEVKTDAFNSLVLKERNGVYESANTKKSFDWVADEIKALTEKRNIKSEVVKLCKIKTLLNSDDKESNKTSPEDILKGILTIIAN